MKRSNCLAQEVPQSSSPFLLVKESHKLCTLECKQAEGASDILSQILQ